MKQAGANGDSPAEVVAVTCPKLLEDIRAFVRRFVILPAEEATDLIALWVLATWTADCFWSAAYLRVVSAAPESGKLRLFDVLAMLVSGRGWWSPLPPQSSTANSTRSSPPSCSMKWITGGSMIVRRPLPR
jgi:hypothetical protein